MLIDDSYHPSSITMLNLDTVFNPQVMTFYLDLLIDGTMVELNTKRRSFICSWVNSTTDTQCGKVCNRINSPNELWSERKNLLKIPELTSHLKLIDRTTIWKNQIAKYRSLVILARQQISFSLTLIKNFYS